jgi:uncharacterized protein YecE (DUF72 family)
MPLFVGTAGWTVPRQHLPLFSGTAEGATLSHLERYATRLCGVEINSSFHRPHRRATWERWAAVTPDRFRFAVKVPKTVTHNAQLVNTGALLQEFFDAARGLGQKLGPVLVQLPPKLPFDEGLSQEFFTTLRELHDGSVVLEPRNATWFSASANRIMRDFQIARVAADPPKGSELAAQPGGWPEIRYWRLHGAPRTYYSDYEEAWLHSFAEELKSANHPSQQNETWVIFDNTALGHATANAVWLDCALRQ